MAPLSWPSASGRPSRDSRSPTPAPRSAATSPSASAWRPWYPSGGPRRTPWWPPPTRPSTRPSTTAGTASGSRPGWRRPRRPRRDRRPDGPGAGGGATRLQPRHHALRQGDGLLAAAREVGQSEIEESRPLADEQERARGAPEGAIAESLDRLQLSAGGAAAHRGDGAPEDRLALVGVLRRDGDGEERPPASGRSDHSLQHGLHAARRLFRGLGLLLVQLLERLGHAGRALLLLRRRVREPRAAVRRLLGALHGDARDLRRLLSREKRARVHGLLRRRRGRGRAARRGRPLVGRRLARAGLALRGLAARAGQAGGGDDARE